MLESGGGYRAVASPFLPKFVPRPVKNEGADIAARGDRRCLEPLGWVFYSDLPKYIA